ncbi:unnamed protein product, partial [Brenthis ino]
MQMQVVNCEMVVYVYEECEESLYFDEFCLYLFDGLNPRRYYCSLLKRYLFNMVHFEDYEVIIIFKLDAPKSTIYATPIFESFFSKHFDLNAECLLDFGVTITGNACVMLWSKRVTQFDEAFYKNLLQKLKPLFPFSFKSSANTPVPLSYDWYCTIPTQENDLGSSSVNELGFKRQRCVQPNFIINYDKQFQNKSQLQLSLHFNVTDTSRSEKLKIIKSAKAKSQKSHLRVNVFNNTEFCDDPFVAVFKLNQIKPI